MTIREQWRRAALTGYHQIHFKRDGTIKWSRGTSPQAHCAISLVGYADNPARFPHLDQAAPCPVDGCGYATTSTSQLAVHLNNDHEWDWLTLANKYPAILPEDRDA